MILCSAINLLGAGVLLGKKKKSITQFSSQIIKLKEAIPSFRWLLNTSGLWFFRFVGFVCFVLFCYFTIIIKQRFTSLFIHMHGCKEWDITSPFISRFGWLNSYVPATLFFSVQHLKISIYHSM